MERYASLSKEMMTAGGGGRKVQNQLEMQNIAYSDCCHFTLSLALLLDLKARIVVFCSCSACE